MILCLALVFDLPSAPCSLSLSWNFHVQNHRSYTRFPHIENFIIGVFLCLHHTDGSLRSSLWSHPREACLTEQWPALPVLFFLVLDALQLYGPFLSAVVCTHFTRHLVQLTVSKSLLLGTHGTEGKNFASWLHCSRLRTHGRPNDII